MRNNIDSLDARLLREHQYSVLVDDADNNAYLICHLALFIEHESEKGPSQWLSSLAGMMTAARKKDGSAVARHLRSMRLQLDEANTPGIPMRNL